MFTETTSAFVWDCIWQSTIWLAIGSAASMFWRHWPARAHRVILLALLGCLAAPFLSLGVRQSGWGLLSRPASELAGYYGNERALQVNPDLKDQQPLATTHSTQQAPEAASLSKSSISSGNNLSSAATESFGVEDSISWVKLFVCTWVVLSIWVLCNMLLSIFRELSILRNAQPITDPKLEQVLGQTMTKLSLRGTQPRICSSDRIRCPVIFCWGRRPTLLLPGRFVWSPEELAGLLSHELAHWKRRDHWAALVGELVVCCLPWQPLAWWAKRRLEHLNELSCDCWVVASGEPADRYAEALLGLAQESNSALTLPAIKRVSQLESRVRQILREETSSPAPGQMWTSLATVTSICAAAVMAVFQAQTTVAAEKSIADNTEEKVAGAAQAQIAGTSLSIKKLVMPKESQIYYELSISPDGRKAAFPGGVGSPGFSGARINIVDLHDGSVVQVNTGIPGRNRGQVTRVLWSPDGGRVIYDHAPSMASDFEKQDWKYSLRTVSATGGDSQTLYESIDRRIDAHCWSKDGKWIVATLRPGQRKPARSLIMIPTDGGDAKLIKAEGWTGSNATLSPDGRLLAFQRQQDGWTQVFLLSLENASEIPVGPVDQANLFPQWSHDGRFLLFKGNRAGSFGFWAQRIENSKPEGKAVLFKTDVGPFSKLSQVLNDGKLVYWTRSPGIDVYRVSVNSDTGEIAESPKLITTGRGVVPSPDDRWLAYTAFTDGTGAPSFSELRIKTSDETNERIVRSKVSNPHVLGWFPDQKSLLVANWGPPGAKYNLHRVEVDSGSVENLSEQNVADARTVRLSPDGRRVAFAGPHTAGESADRNSIAFSSGAICVRKAEADAESVLLYAATGELVRSPCWSPDGTRIAFAAINREKQVHRLLTIPSDGGEPTEPARFEWNPRVISESIAWSPNGKFIVYGLRSQIWMVPLSSGKATRLSSLEELNASHLHWGAKSTELFFTGQGPRPEPSEYWIMEHYLPGEEQASR